MKNGVIKIFSYQPLDELKIVLLLLSEVLLRVVFADLLREVFGDPLATPIVQLLSSR